MNNKKIIKSISFDQNKIIKNIIKLHNNGQDIECDPTYSKGNFYTNKINKPKYKFDLNPQTKDTVKADCRNLPLKNNSISSLMFDPPFLATKGKSLKLNNNNNKINKRFGVFSTEKELHILYKDSIKEFYRVLKKDGLFIFKCQDKVSSSIQYFTHCFIMYKSIELGFYPKDLFILTVKNRIIANWQIKNQQHARKFHSYFWVFKKQKPKTNYKF